ncbi:CDC26 family anaphase-promoting complex subunit [Aspergillus foveolatus]|uniref:CDC26 family anaphase-promoting complex subunit n=1 Tax=Aspergillus foveolatus TaxID=210207 RepID=UPI003CCD7EF3
MLRLKPTRITLTEDDLCYHIDSIFHRNHDLAIWHQKRKSSGNSYDGDEDEDEFSQVSDTDTIPETPPESECDEVQSQPLAGDNQQEFEPGEGNTNADDGTSSHEQRPVTVRFALPKPSTSSSDRRSQVIRGGKTAIQLARSAHSLHLSFWLALCSNADWNKVNGVSTSQHNRPNINSLPLSLPRPIQVILETYITNLLTSVTALPLRLPRLKSEITQPGISPKKKQSSIASWPFAYDLWIILDAKAPPAITFLESSRPSRSPNVELVLRRYPPQPKMKRTYRTESASTGKRSHREKSGVDRTTAIKDQECLSARAPNSGSAAAQLSPSKGHGSNPFKRRLSSTTENARRADPDEDSENVGHLADRDTISRGTQTDSDLTSTLESELDDESMDNPLHRGLQAFIVFAQNNPGRQENIAPDNAAKRSPHQPVWQDPFISAMFPEPNSPAYDPTNRIRRGMQGYINPPTSRGSQARNDRGELVQLVHPTLVDARVYQEYVHRLIAELDRPPHT